MDERTRDLAPLLAWLVSLGVAIVAFTAMGGGQLAAPPVTDPGAWSDWAADRDGVVATVAVLRLVVLALAWYLVGVTTIGAVGRLARWARLVRVADALSIPVVRRVLQTSLGVGLATTVVVSSTGVVLPPTGGPTIAAAASQSVADTPAMRPLDVAGRAAAPSPAPASPSPTMIPIDAPHADSPPPPGMHPLPATPATQAGAEAPAPATPTAPPTDAPTPDTGGPTMAPPATPDAANDGDASDAEPDEDLVTVAEGDHLWGIAERHLQQARGGQATDAEVADYWHRLVEVNRGRLVDPEDPDLVLPGQRFVLPDLETDAGPA